MRFHKSIFLLVWKWMMMNRGQVARNQNIQKKKKNKKKKKQRKKQKKKNKKNNNHKNHRWETKAQKRLKKQLYSKNK